MANTIISADSTVDLTDELRDQYGIHYHPFHIEHRGKDYIDNVTITSADVFASYAEDGSLPKTGAASPFEFLSHFKKFVDEGMEVVHISLASSLSSAYENARAAAADLPGVYVVDSQNLSSASGLLAMQAARMAEEGMSASEIAKRLEEMRSHAHASFVLDTLDFLAAGGRCSTLLASVSNALKIHPEIIVSNEDGSMKVGKLYRGSTKKVMRKYLEDTLAKYPDIIADDVFATTTGCPKEFMDAFTENVRELFRAKRVHQSAASVTISSHCGPNCYGVLFLTQTASN